MAERDPWGHLTASWWSGRPTDDEMPEAAAPSTPSPIGGLVERRGIYSRNGIVWVSARAWRKDAKREDVAAVRQAKAALPESVIESAASELAALARQLVGRFEGWSVTTVAVGHSRRPDSFAVRLAAAVARMIGAPFEKAFADRFCAGVSHPKEFVKLPPLEWARRPAGPILLVDDIATSGWHVEEALAMLRDNGNPSLGLVWISGTVRE